MRFQPNKLRWFVRHRVFDDGSSYYSLISSRNTYAIGQYMTHSTRKIVAGPFTREWRASQAKDEIEMVSEVQQS